MRRTLLMVAATSLIACFGQSTKAAVITQLRLSDGVTTIVVDDGDANDANAAAGVITFTGSLGVWTINATTGVLVSETPGNLDLNSLNATSSGGGTLTIEYTANGFTGPVSGLVGEIGGTLASGATLNASAALNDSNVLYDMVSPEALLTLGPITTSPFAAAGTADGPSVPGLYSMTLKTVLVHSSNPMALLQVSSYDFMVTAAPEPATVLIWTGVGLVGLVAASRRRMKGSR